VPPLPICSAVPRPQGPLLGISIDAAPLCPDQDLSADLEQFILVMCILALILPAVQAVLMIVPTMCINSPATMDRASRFGQLVGVGFALTNFGWCLHGAINVIYGPGAINSCKEPSLSVSSSATEPPSALFMAAAAAVSHGEALRALRARGSGVYIQLPGTSEFHVVIMLCTSAVRHGADVDQPDHDAAECMPELRHLPSEAGATGVADELHCPSCRHGCVREMLTIAKPLVFPMPAVFQLLAAAGRCKA